MAIQCLDCVCRLEEKERQQVYGCKLDKDIPVYEMAKSGKCPFHTRQVNEYEFSGGC